MTISAISDGESGLSVRTKLNDLIAKTNTINADSTSVVSYFVDANSTTAAIRNGSVSAPFLTLSAAMTAIGKPTSAADSARLIVVNIESGSYTETVNIPEGRMMKIMCNGYVALTGDVIYQSDGNARLGSGVRSFLSISGGDNNLAVSTHIARQGGMLINGRIVRKGTSVTGITTHDLYLSNVQVTGGIGWDASIAQPGGTSVYLVRSRLQGTTSDQLNDASTGFPLVFQQVEDSKIEGTLKLSRFGGAVRTEFSSVAMTLLQAGGDIPPYGFYDCVWTGTNSIAAPANSLKLNGVSFVNSAAVTLSGGVTRQRIEDFTPLATGATDNAVTRFDGTTGLLQTSGVTIDDTNNVKGAASVQLTGGTGTAGTLSWNDGDGTLDIALKGGQTVLQVGQEQVVRVLNNNGAALSDGQVVYITGAQGQRPTVALADADIEATSSATIGIVTEPIANGAEGFVTLSGLVRHVNTSAWAEGAELWVSATAGELTATKPASPQVAFFVGVVVRQHATAGSIFVRAAMDGSFQPADADLSAIANLAGTSGILRKTAVDTWTLDTATYESQSNKGVANGYAPLDVSGKVPSANLPALSSTLDGLADVSAATTAANDVLVRNAGNTEWVNAQLKTVNSTSLIGAGNITTPTLAANTFSGKQAAPEFESPVIDGDIYIEGYRSNATATGTVNIDLSLGGVFEYTLTGDVTFTVSNAPSLSNEILSFVVRINQGATPYVINWFGGLTWLTEGGAPSAPTANKSAEYIFTTTNGTNYVGRKGVFN